MDIANKIHELTEETLSFAEIISHSDNPASLDFRTACDLFSQHLSHELDLLSSNIYLQNTRPEIQQASHQLCKLNELINPKQADNPLTYDWNSKLMEFFSQLQSLKNIAA